MALNGNAAQVSGIVPPMITPLTEEGAIDVAAVQRLVEYLIAGGVGGIFILGTSGEGPWLTPKQRRTLIHKTAEAIAGRVPLLVGALEPGTNGTRDAMREAEENGANILVIGAPYYFQVTETVILDHVETLAKQSSLPMLYYNIPSMTHNPLLASDIHQLLSIDSLIGIKDSAGDWDNFLKLVQLKATRPDFLVFQGAERKAAAAVLAGADGIVPGLGNLTPGIFSALYSHARAGEVAAADQLQEQIDQLWELHTAGYWLVCLKYAAATLGFGCGMTIGHGQLRDANAQAQVQRLLQLHAQR